jgi:phosphopantetheinyl transferase
MVLVAHILLDSSHAVDLIERWCRDQDYMYASKFKRPHRQKQSLAGRCLLRMIYALNHNPKVDYLDIVSEPNGKPVLSHDKGTQPLWGSISHSGQMVCAVISEDGPVGIDVEQENPTRDICRLVQFYYPTFKASPQEAYKVWTQLEAFTKMTGDGLGSSPILTLENNKDDFLENCRSHSWHSRVMNGFHISLCLTNSNR